MASRDSAWNPLQWARDLMGVWQDTRLIVLTAHIAAVYAAILIPFKDGIPLIPGFAELRPANAIPLVAALLFGPATQCTATPTLLLTDVKHATSTTFCAKWADSSERTAPKGPGRVAYTSN